MMAFPPFLFRLLPAAASGEHGLPERSAGDPGRWQVGPSGAGRRRGGAGGGHAQVSGRGTRSGASSPAGDGLLGRSGGG